MISDNLSKETLMSFYLSCIKFILKQNLETNMCIWYFKSQKNNSISNEFKIYLILFYTLSLKKMFHPLKIIWVWNLFKSTKLLCRNYDSKH